MVRTLYFECYSGISGDMSTAALLDLGANRDVLDKALSSLNVNGFRTKSWSPESRRMNLRCRAVNSFVSAIM